MKIEVADVTAGYDETDVLRGVSLHADDGECVALFGPNGHGKTTLFRALSGLIRVRAGSIAADGVTISNRRPSEIVDLGVIHVPQGSSMFPTMTVEECLLLGGYSSRGWSLRQKGLSDVFTMFPRLADRRGQRSNTLSGGERQMLAIGMGLMAQPRALLLDEPTMGLAPILRRELGVAVSAIAASGVTLVVVDQDLELLYAVADRLYAMERGRVTGETSKGEVMSPHELSELYFGVSES